MKRTKVWIGIGVSLICLALALRGIQWGQVWQHLGRVHYPYLVAAVLILITGLGARAFRWQLLFFPRRDVSRTRLFAISNIGYLLINILPARVGDLARAYLISREARSVPPMRSPPSSWSASMTLCQPCCSWPW